MALHVTRTIYSRAEYISDGMVHVLGLLFALAAIPALITLTALNDGRAFTVAAASVYGVTMVLMLSCSAMYNMVPSGRWTRVLQRLDHSAIYLKIAGTFTPFVVISGASVGLLGGIWGAALAGVGMKMISPRRFRWIGLALYLAMGWVGVGMGWGAFSALPGGVLLLIAAGGLLYTGGVVFYLWDRLPFHNTIWHAFVLTATALFYTAILTAVGLPWQSIHLP